VPTALPLPTVTPLPTVIIVHPRERRSKCTVARLRGDPRFAFFRSPRRPPDLSQYVRLGLDGPPLSPADASHGLLVLDGTWRWVAGMEQYVAEVPTRTLPPLTTAYPRVSKTFDDPTQGLATIEAVYAALAILGRDVSGLLDGYPWGSEFLAGNQRILEETSGSGVVDRSFPEGAAETADADAKF
jgi:pre-rRNA-processing protein TSR3